MRSKPNWKDCITSHFFVHQSYQKRKACLWLCKYYSILLLRSIDVSCLSCFSRVPSVEWDYRLGILVPSQVSEFGLRLILQTLYFLKRGSIYDMWQKNTVLPTFMNIQLWKKDSLEMKKLKGVGNTGIEVVFSVFKTGQAYLSFLLLKTSSAVKCLSSGSRAYSIHN